MRFGVIINFTDGCRALLRDEQFSRYTGTDDLIACGDWCATRRSNLAAKLTRQEAESWMQDLHRKTAHMKYRGVQFAEVVAIENVRMGKRQYWSPLCPKHSPRTRKSHDSGEK